MGEISPAEWQHSKARRQVRTAADISATTVGTGRGKSSPIPADGCHSSGFLPAACPSRGSICSARQRTLQTPRPAIYELQPQNVPGMAHTALGGLTLDPTHTAEDLLDFSMYVVIHLVNISYACCMQSASPCQAAIAMLGHTTKFHRYSFKGN